MNSSRDVLCLANMTQQRIRPAEPTETRTTVSASSQGLSALVVTDPVNDPQRKDLMIAALSASISLLIETSPDSTGEVDHRGTINAGLAVDWHAEILTVDDRPVPAALYRVQPKLWCGYLSDHGRDACFALLGLENPHPSFTWVSSQSVRTVT